jgi:sodium-dependent dicarboxylate transporter 2/3/5
LLSWRDLTTVRWDVLILFGGGLALADAIATSGLATTIGEALQALVVVPLPLLLLIIMFSIVFLGELASNTAVAAIFLPIAGAAAIAVGAPALTFALPIALAASLGFMLPVATPPNAIVYGSSLVSSQQMLRAGLILNLTTVPIVALLTYLLGDTL